MTRIFQHLIALLLGVLVCIVFVMALRFFMEGVDEVASFISPFVVNTLDWHTPLGQLSQFPVDQWQAKSFMLFVFLAGAVIIFASKLNINGLLVHPFNNQKELSATLFSYILYWFLSVAVIGALCFLWSLF